jgi:hypothetical protein
MKHSFQIFAFALLLFTAACSSSKKTAATAPVANATTAATSDGSSFEKAIVVKSITEEYAWVKKVCPECKFKKQALRQNNKKYYDLLYFDKDGTTVIYYFDINSFYGKMF